MHKLREALESVAHKIALTKPLLGRARRRGKKFGERAAREEAARLAAQEAADKARQHPKLARELDRKAARCEHRRVRAEAKATKWRSLMHLRLGRFHDLQAEEAKITAEITRYRKEHGVDVKGNKVTGGTPGQRWRVALLLSCKNCSANKRRNFYSMSGDWDIDHELVGGPHYGNRSDCSSTVTGWAKACGFPDPNGERYGGGYTGTLMRAAGDWREVSRSEMERAGKPAYIVYGGGVGHHTEGYPTHGDFTCGHGDARVDHGVIDDFGDGDLRCFIYDPK